jgi:predicted Ser/Thr protein kinase
MTRERWKQVEELYHAALEKEPGDRAAFVAQAAAGDRELQIEVESLLAQDDPRPLLERPAWQAVSLATKTAMELSPGAELGPYRIEALLGAGGMGWVYKARDTRLNRTVAVKLCREEFSERLQHEAMTAASLNHPNICTLHDVGPNYLVMEYVEGKEIKGPLPLKKVIEYASQICDALDAAHRKGIVHRDIKPSNILVTRGGIKVLDFGLAKMAGQEALTRHGAVMGTPAYMAPEQWEGKEADARSDIYSLGLVVYEMATGERAPGKTLEPAALDRVVKTCLAAEPEERWQSAREVKLALELARPAGSSQAGEVRAGTGSGRGRAWRSLAPWLVAGIAVIMAAAAMMTGRSPRVSGAPAMNTVIPIPPEPQLVSGSTAVPFDVSEDGTKLVYVAREGGRGKLFLRPLDQFDVKPLPGTEDATSPFFSPDGRWVGFVVQRRLFKAATDWGAPVLIAEVEESGDGACWSRDDRIVYGSASGLMMVPAGGGKPSRLTSLGAGEVNHSQPRFAAGGNAVLFTAISRPWRRRIAAVSLEDGRRTTIVDGHQPVHLLSGQLVYATDDALRAARFDPAGLRLSGSPFTLIDDVYTGHGNSRAYFRMTPSGMLVYVSGRNEHWLVRVDRAGRTTPITPRRAGYRMPRVSRNGRLVAVVIDPPDEGDSHIWILEVERGAFLKLTREGHNLNPAFTHDGSRLAWTKFSGDPTMYWQPVDGSCQPEPLSPLKPSEPGDLSRDGKYLAGLRVGGAGAKGGVCAPVPAMGAALDGFHGRRVAAGVVAGRERDLLPGGQEDDGGEG